MHLNVLNRRIHYWASAVIAVPILIVAITGTILQLKKHAAWVQPPEQRGSGGVWMFIYPFIGRRRVRRAHQHHP